MPLTIDLPELVKPDDIPEGWKSFTAALPPNLYDKLLRRAEALEVRMRVGAVAVRAAQRARE
ncbi:hypothetical protein [Armatimonas sp.]|uniref:hypothetical protein n=1 Tax=Armatimonas sp. TaxID=1872638 RepID=UPI00286A2B45|nr:hypothetical protein [Armatimonas sp.]